MRYIPYRYNDFIYGHREYITECPFGLIAKTGITFKVGGNGCQQCPYHHTQHHKNRIVECKYQ